MTDTTGPEGKDEFALILDIDCKLGAVRAMHVALTDLLECSVPDFKRRLGSLREVAIAAEALAEQAEEAAQELYSLYYARKLRQERP